MTYRILAVEDSPTQATKLATILEQQGILVTLAANADEALERFQAPGAELDLVVSDIVMPGDKDGYELCRRIKEISGQEVPVVLLTSLCDPLDILRGLECGADNFITKPYDSDFLLDRIRGLLDTRAARRQSKVRMGVNVVFLGRTFTITAEREQILDLLISTFEDAVRQNRDLRAREAELELARADLARYAGTLEADLKRFFDLSSDLICVSDLNGSIKRVNPAWTRCLGWSEVELVSREWLDVVHPGDREATARALGALRAGNVIEEFQNRCRHLDGSSRWIEWAAVHNPVHQLVYATGRDVTERKRLETQLQQAQKLECVGRLAGGVAHDFNNLLTVILAEADLTLAPGGEEVDVYGAVREMRRAAERGANLTRQLLAFSRQDVVASEVVDLNEVVRDLDSMLSRIIGEQVNWSVRLTSGPSTVVINRGHLEQVIVNLVVNARDAMPEGGDLLVETRRVCFDGTSTEASSAGRRGEYVVLAVSDTGVGMSEEVQQRLFEPFFTTKAPGLGTGLGLSTVYGVIQQAGGHVEVHSEPQRGSRFDVYLRLINAQPVESRPKGAPIAAGGGGVILLVEDEGEVRSVMLRALRALGYEVIPTSGAEEALAVLDQMDHRPDLLLTDLMLPGMNGLLLAEQARRRHPGLRVLYVSGYPGEPTAKRPLLDEKAHFLHKPFTLQALGAKVRAALETNPEHEEHAS